MNILEKTFGRLFIRLVKFTAVLKGTLFILRSLSRAVKAIVNPTAELQVEIARLAAVTGASVIELTALNMQIEELGARSQFTAVQIARLQKELAKKGFAPVEILDTVKAVTDLSIVTGEDLVESGSVVASTLRIFNIEASESTRVVDVLTAAFNNSALDLGKFRDSVKLVGPLARQANISLELTTAILGRLADAGLTGTLAATGLKNILNELVQEGSDLNEVLGFTVQNDRDLIEAFQILAQEGISLSEASQLVNERAKAAFATLTNGTSTIEKLSAEFAKSEGNAAKLALEIEDNLDGDIKKLTSSFDAAQRAIGDAFGPEIRGSIQSTTKFLLGVVDSIDKIRLAFDTIRGTVKGVFFGAIEGFKALTKAAESAASFIFFTFKSLNPFDPNRGLFAEAAKKALVQTELELQKGLFNINKTFEKEFDEQIEKGKAALREAGKVAGSSIAEGVNEGLAEDIDLTDAFTSLEGTESAATRDEIQTQFELIARDIVNTLNAVGDEAKEANVFDFFTLNDEQLAAIDQTLTTFRGTDEELRAIIAGQLEAFEMAEKQKTLALESQSNIRSIIIQNEINFVRKSLPGLIREIGKQGRQGFELAKKLALAQATVRGYDAIQAAASAAPFPFNVPGIVVETARAALTVRNISETQFGGAAKSITSGPTAVQAPPVQDIGQINDQFAREEALRTLGGETREAELLDAVNRVSSKIEEQTDTQAALARTKG